MVGLVIVSHSRPLAQALVDLVKQVASPTAPIALAAGVGDDRQTFGTDAIEIMEAIELVSSQDGVLVLMDLGSAVLSAQMALDLLPPEIGEKVRFCSAPLVEGAVAAGVQISLGSPLEMVYQEARQSLFPKQDQLGDAAEVGETVSAAPAPLPAEELVTVTLINQHGLHARPAARFVQMATRFKADIQVKNETNGKGPASARSLNAIATLGAVQNHQIRIDASGDEAAQALKALKELVESGFGEPTAVPGPAEPAKTPLPAIPVEPVQKSSESTNYLRAVPISEGYALGPLYRYEPPRPTISKEPAKDPNVEWKKFQAAVAATRQDISQRYEQVKRTLNADEAAIFEAHELILQDPDMLDRTNDGIFKNQLNAAAAWDAAVNTVADTYRSLDDPYQKQRALDVEDVGRQVLLALSGAPAAAPLTFPQPVILYAEDLTPTETSQLDMRQVLGIVTAGGGPTSHSAILARGLGIPAVAGSGMFLAHQPAGGMVGLNGFTGEVWVDPSGKVQSSLGDLRTSWQAERERLLHLSKDLAKTADGSRVEVFANIGGPNDAAVALENGAEGVGLLRTEFLFLTRETAPSEQEQYELLHKIFSTMGQDHPVIVRTMDVGGDKNLPYIDLPKEANPFLGMRALRLSLEKPELFLPQLRAILRAGEGFPCRIMFPMVADVDEVRAARGWLEKAHAELTAENIPHAWPVEVGIMVEIPSAALLSRTLANEVDFFSIGTNDLTQYTLAAERGNPALAYLADGLNPAVLQLIQRVAESAHAAGKYIGICGELGGDPQAIPILVGLHVDELSMNPPAVPRAKAIIRKLQMSAAEALAEKALQAESSEAVRKLAKAFASAE